MLPRAGQHNGDHRNHQKRHNDLHGIRDKRNHVPDLKISHINAVAANPHDEHAHAVHNQHHRGHHHCHHPVCKKLRGHEILVRHIKAFLLKLFPRKRTNDRKPRENLPGYQVQTVHQLLHDLKLWQSDSHQNKHE